MVARAPALDAAAERVRAGRIARGLTQLGLAQEVTACGAKTSRTLIGAIERSEVVPSLAVRAALERALADPGLAELFPEPVGSMRYTG